MHQHLSEQERMPKDEIHLESRIWEIRTSGLVYEVKPRRRNLLRRKGFTLIERVPMRRTFLVDIVSIPPIVHFGRIA